MFLTSSSLKPSRHHLNLALQFNKFIKLNKTLIRTCLFISCLLLINSLIHGRSFGDEFVRGDVNSDFTINLTDPLNTLGYLFLGNVPLSCEDALDSDDDGQHSINDAIYTLSYLFLGTSQPPKPFPQAGSDPSDDQLSCGEEDPVDYELPDHISSMDKLLNPSQAITQSEFSSAVKVPLDLHEAIQSLEEGQAIASLWEGAPEHWVEGLSILAPKDNTKPIVQFANTTFKLPVNGCVKIAAQQVARNSFLPNTEKDIFLRGDVSADGKVDEIDLEMLENSLLNHIFHYEDQMCDDAWDVNDDGEVNSDDYFQLYDYLFERSFIPFPNETTGCGVDPTPDNLGNCEAGYCRAGHDQLQFKAEPEEICEPGWHRVKVSVSRLTNSETGERVADPESTVVRETLVYVCSAEEECSVETEQHIFPIWPFFYCKAYLTEIVHPPIRKSKFYSRSFNELGEQTGVSADSVPLTNGAISSLASHNGKGPHHQFTTRRSQTNCKTPRTQDQAQGSGYVKYRISALCFDLWGRKISGLINPSVSAEGFYRSTLFVNTDSSMDSKCSSFTPEVEALSQDMTSFTVGEKIGFVKSASLQSGNKITFSPRIQMGNGISVDPDGKPTINIDASIEISQTVEDDTGRLERDLFANNTVHYPFQESVEIDLFAEGETRFSGKFQSHGLSAVYGRGCGVWGVVKFDIPWMSPIPFSFRQHLEDDDEVKKEMDSLYESFMEHNAR